MQISDVYQGVPNYVAAAVNYLGEFLIFKVRTKFSAHHSCRKTIILICLPFILSQLTQENLNTSYKDLALQIRCKY